MNKSSNLPEPFEVPAYRVLFGKAEQEHHQQVGNVKQGLQVKMFLRQLPSPEKITEGGKNKKPKESNRQQVGKNGGQLHHEAEHSVFERHTIFPLQV